MTVRQLRYFQKLGHTAHFGKASAELYISQPSLSRAISQLEDELGVKLFEKSGRNVLLSDKGRVFLEYVDKALGCLDRGVEAIQTAPGEQEISIGCITPAVSTYLAPILKRYRHGRKEPFRCRMWTGMSEELVDKLLAGVYDVVFCSYVSEREGVSFYPVHELPFCVVMRKDDPLAGRDYIYPEELDALPMLFTEAKNYTQLICSLLNDYGVKPLQCGRANEETALISMVEAGIGVFISTDYPQLHSENIALVPLKQDRFHRYFYMALCEGRKLPPAVKSFTEYIIKNSLIKAKK